MSTPKKIWLSYAWVDNSGQDIDYIIQRLRHAQIDVRYDREQIVAGARLWSQIGNFIGDPSESDGWAIAMSRSSLRSEPCQEELAIALDRALRARGDTYPLIGILLEPIEAELIPPAIRVRLYVSISDPDWVARVGDALTGVNTRKARTRLAPYHIRRFVLPGAGGGGFEVRPRAGRWKPGLAAVPIAEEVRLKGIVTGNPGAPPLGHTVTIGGGGRDDKARFVYQTVAEAIDPWTSMFILLGGPVTRLVFGSFEENYEINPSNWLP